MVGLACVDEFIPIYNDEMEPYYQCNLCGNIGEANALYNHVLNAKHQQKFFEKKFPEDPRVLDLRRPDLLRLATRFDEKSCLKFYPKRLIRTYESDLLFPWPQGKVETVYSSFFSVPH